MVNKIVIELDDDGTLLDLDIQDDDRLSIEDTVQGFAEGVGAFFASLYNIAEKDAYNLLIDFFMSNLVESMNLPNNIDSEEDYEIFMQAVADVDAEARLLEDGRIDYYNTKKATLEAFKQVKEKNAKADNIRHLFGNKK